jgi:arylsulfatase
MKRPKKRLRLREGCAPRRVIDEAERALIGRRAAFRHGLEPFEIGRDSITAVSPDYKDRGAFPFTGSIEKVTFDLTPASK